MSVNDYNSRILHLLQKKSPKYDIFFFYNEYAGKNIKEHFEDLYNYLPGETLNLYKYDYLEQYNNYNGRLIGLVNIYIYIFNL